MPCLRKSLDKGKLKSMSDRVRVCSLWSRGNMACLGHCLHDIVHQVLGRMQRGNFLAKSIKDGKGVPWNLLACKYHV